MNLWPGRSDRFEVNLSDYPDMESAIRAFANWQQVLNVYGPADRIAECYALWDRIATEDKGTEREIPPANVTDWHVQARPFPALVVK